MEKFSKINIIIFGILFLIVLLIIGTIVLNSIKEKESVKQKNFDYNMKAVLEYIEEGNYLKAYRKLIGFSTYNEEQEQTVSQKKKDITKNALSQLSEVVKNLIEQKQWDKALKELEKNRLLKDTNIDSLRKQIEDELKQQKEQKEAKEAEEEQQKENEKKAKEAEEKEKKEAKEAEEKKQKEIKEAEEKARKKSQGVNLGMSKQDVLDSSWGTPNKVNTTTTKYGVHEQWCYSGNNYLYFENGKLTSIQN